MKFSTAGLTRAALVAGFGLMVIARSLAGAEGSLTDLDIEYSELKVTLEKILGENKQLREALADTQKTLTDMRQNLAATSAETEVFKRQSTELKLRMEALGLDLAGGNNAKLEQRLLAAVNDLRVITQERKTLSEALIRLSDSAAVYAKSATGAPPEARLSLEGEIRNANMALGVGSGNAVDAAPMPSTITDAMAISVKEDLSLVVINLGSKQGVKVGMPFRAMRGEKVIGAVQVVDVREKIAGAVIQHLSSEQNPIKVGDRLVVDAKP
jgi:hypothetical protein